MIKEVIKEKIRLALKVLTIAVLSVLVFPIISILNGILGPIPTKIGISYITPIGTLKINFELSKYSKLKLSHSLFSNKFIFFKIFSLTKYKSSFAFLLSSVISKNSSLVKLLFINESYLLLMVISYIALFINIEDIWTDLLLAYSYNKFSLFNVNIFIII